MLATILKIDIKLSLVLHLQIYRKTKHVKQILVKHLYCTINYCQHNVIIFFIVVNFLYSTINYFFTHHILIFTNHRYYLYNNTFKFLKF